MLVVNLGVFQVLFNNRLGEISALPEQSTYRKIGIKFNKAGVDLFPTCDDLSSEMADTRRQLLSEIALEVEVQYAISTPPEIALDINIQVSS